MRARLMEKRFADRSITIYQREIQPPVFPFFFK